MLDRVVDDCSLVDARPDDLMSLVSEMIEQLLQSLAIDPPEIFGIGIHRIFLRGYVPLEFAGAKRSSNCNRVAVNRCDRAIDISRMNWYPNS